MADKAAIFEFAKTKVQNDAATLGKGGDANMARAKSGTLNVTVAAEAQKGAEAAYGLKQEVVDKILPKIDAAAGKTAVATKTAAEQEEAAKAAAKSTAPTPKMGGS